MGGKEKKNEGHTQWVTSIADYFQFFPNMVKR